MSERDAERSVSQTVRAQLALRDMILSGRLRPGERISELQAVDITGVSRTPVRLALVRLEDEGLLQAIPSGGFMVKAFTERDILDDYAAHMLNLVDVKKFRPLRIAIDAGNGMAGITVPRVFRDLPVEIAPLYFEPDGTFPNHPANPIELENTAALRKAVVENGYDLGAAFERSEAVHGLGVPGPTGVVGAREVGHEEEVEMGEVIGHVFRSVDQGRHGRPRRAGRQPHRGGQRSGGGRRLADRADAADPRSDDQRVARIAAFEDDFQAAPHRAGRHGIADDVVLVEVDLAAHVTLDAGHRVDDDALAAVVELEALGFVSAHGWSPFRSTCWRGGRPRRA